MAENAKRKRTMAQIPPDEKDYELARTIDARKESPMSAMTKLNDSMFSKAMHGGMMKKQTEQDPNAIPVPSGMRADRVAFPPVEKKEPTKTDEELTKTKRLLDVAYKRIEIVEREKQRLVDNIETLKRAYIALRDKPSELQDLLERRGFTGVEELEKFILDAKESQRKGRLRQERYNRRRYG